MHLHASRTGSTGCGHIGGIAETADGSHTIYTYGNEVYDNTEALRVAPFKLIRLNSELRQNT